VQRQSANLDALNQDDPRRHSKEVCTSASRIKAPKRIKKVESDPNIRIPGGNILRQLVPLQRRISMPIIPKRSGVPCAANVPPFDERPIGMPKQPQGCRGCYGCTGWCTIFFGSIVPPEKFPLSLWASSRGGCPCRKFSRFKWHKRRFQKAKPFPSN
jgi:hypothetical protein